VEVKRKECEGQYYVLVINEERAIRESLEKWLIQDLERLSESASARGGSGGKRGFMKRLAG